MNKIPVVVTHKSICDNGKRRQAQSQQKCAVDRGGGNPVVRPFLAVRLEQGNTALTADQINSNEYVFLEQSDGAIKILSLFIKGSAAAIVAGEDVPQPSVQNKQPHWRMFYACGGGGGGGEFEATELAKNNLRATSLQWLEASGGSLTTKSKSVTVSWQLRYEYALNLNQKLGSSLTRVGLEYTT